MTTQSHLYKLDDAMQVPPAAPKKRVVDLIGPELDAWVARAEQLPLCAEFDQGDHIVVGTGNGDLRIFSPSTDPAQGQPIMDRWHIGTQYRPHYPSGGGEWMARCTAEWALPGIRPLITGPTMLIAGMRARVWMIYGDEVPA